MSTVPPAPPHSASAATASQQPLARPVVGFEAPERKLQPLPPVEAGGSAANLQQRPEAVRDGRQGSHQPFAPNAPQPEAGQSAPAFTLPQSGLAQPRFRPAHATSPQPSPAPIAAKRRSHDLQAALQPEPRAGQLLRDKI